MTKPVFSLPVPQPGQTTKQLLDAETNRVLTGVYNGAIAAASDPALAQAVADSVAGDSADAIQAAQEAAASAASAASAYQGRQYVTRAAFVADTAYVNGDDAPADGTVVSAGGLQYVRSAGATALPGLPGWLLFGKPAPEHYEAVGIIADGTTLNTTGHVPEAARVDLQGRTAVVSAVPTHFQAFNGAWVIDGRLTVLPSDPLRHAFDGVPFYTGGIPGQSIHTGGLVYRATDRQLYRVISISASHAPEAGAPVLVEVSDDMGQSWRHVQTIYSDSDRSVRAMASRIDGEVITVVVSTVLANGTSPKIFVLRSEAPFHVWVQEEITGLTFAPFIYGDLYRYPASVGGNDTTGLIFYGYTGGEAYAVYTVDGETWTEQVLTGLGALGVNEISICRHGDLDRWSGFGRTSATNTTTRSQFVAITSEDMLTWTAEPDSGIPNMRHTGDDGIPLPDTSFGPFGQRFVDGNVGSPLVCYYHQGRVNAAVWYRESWAINDFDNTLMVFSAPAAEVWSADGAMRNVAPHRIELPERALGMGFATHLPGGGMALIFRAGEGVYDGVPDGVYDAVSSAPYMIVSGTRMPSARPRVAGEGENVWLDPGFTRWSLGTAWEDVTDETRAGKGPDGVRLWTSGASIDLSRAAVPTVVADKLAHRPQWGMLINSTPANAGFSGFEQTHWGMSAVRRFARQEMLFQIWGYGALPNGALRASVVFSSGAGFGTALATFTRTEPVRSYENGLWRATIKVRVGSINGLTFGAHPRVSFRFSAESPDLPWVNFMVVGVKVEIGAYPTPLMPADNAAQEGEFMRRIRRFGFGNAGGIGLITRQTTTQSEGYVPLLDMHRPPVGEVIGALADFRVSRSGGVGAQFSPTSLTAVASTLSAANAGRVVVGHPSDTTFTVATLDSISAGAGIHFYVE